MSEQLHANKIGTLQLAALLILSRLFILLIYVPTPTTRWWGRRRCWASCWEGC